MAEECNVLEAALRLFLGEPAVGRALKRLHQESRFLDWAGKEAHFPGNPAAVNHRFERVGGKLGEAIAV